MAAIKLFIALLACFGAEYATAVNYRLPTNVEPIYYDLELAIDPAHDNFTGNVTIYIQATDVNATDIKHFHVNADASYVTINSVTLNENTTCNHTIDETTSIVHIMCDSGFNGTEQAIVAFEIVTKFSYDASGIYKSSYRNASGETEWFIATQFEPSSARKAFPCFDEPEYKAEFAATITVPLQYRPLFNSEQSSLRNTAAGVVYQFATTPKMSSYLVSLVVSKFEDVSGLEDTTFKIFARAEMENFASTASTYGPQILNLLSTWLQLDYSEQLMNHLFQVAVPKKSGAMENWGLITYGERYILDNGENLTSVAQTKQIVTVMSHEISHQWFGDYVTTDWWSEVWLNEGFAEYMQYYVANELMPDMELDKQFAVEVLQTALATDASPTAVAVVSNESDINTATQESSKFDVITYDKGGSIVRLLGFLLGETNFANGLHEYLTVNNFSSATTEKLLTVLNKSTEYDLDLYMHNWLYQPGYPVVSVTLNNSNVILEQKRFLTSGSENNDSSRWYVPITYTTSKASNFEFGDVIWLSPSDDQHTIAIGNSSEWIIVNLQQSGFYRVLYDHTLYERIANALQTDPAGIHVLNRAQLLDDAFVLARFDYLNLTVAFELAKYLANETDYHPWYTALRHLSWFVGKTGDQTNEDALNSLLLSWLEERVIIPHNVSLPVNQTSVAKLTQALLLQTACKLGHSDCIAYAQQEFARFKNGSGYYLDPDLRDTIICTALRTSTNPQNDFDFIYSLSTNSNLESDVYNLRTDLGCISDATVVKNYLNHLIAENSTIPKEDIQIIFQTIYSGYSGNIDIALDFLVNNTEEIIEHFNGTSVLSTFITNISKNVYTESQLQKLQVLANINNTELAGIKSVITEAITEGNSTVQWISQHQSAFTAALIGSNSIIFLPFNLLIIAMLSYLYVF